MVVLKVKSVDSITAGSIKRERTAASLPSRASRPPFEAHRESHFQMMRKASERLPVVYALTDNAAQPSEPDPSTYVHFSHHPRRSSFVSWIEISQTAAQETASATAAFAVEQFFMQQMHLLGSDSAREWPV
jgi:hypothetical protein